MGSGNSYEQGTDEKSNIKRINVRTEANSKCSLDRVLNLSFATKRLSFNKQCTKANDSIPTKVEEKHEFDSSVIDQEKRSECPYMQQLQKTRSFQKDSANFLTESECNQLINKSKSALTKSTLGCKNNYSGSGSSTITTSDDHIETKFLLDFNLKEFLKMDGSEAKILLFSFDLIKNDLNSVGMIAFMKYL